MKRLLIAAALGLSLASCSVLPTPAPVEVYVERHLPGVNVRVYHDKLEYRATQKVRVCHVLHSITAEPACQNLAIGEYSVVHIPPGSFVMSYVPPKL